MSSTKLRKEVNALIDLYKNKLKDNLEDSKVYKHVVFDEHNINIWFKSLKRHIKYSFEEHDKESKNVHR